MLSVISSHAPLGIDGVLIQVEVDIRRGLPGVDIVGLPDNAVREARERVRVAIRNSGFRFPADRITVNLAPAGIHKEGAAYDLSIALGILISSGQVPLSNERLMVLGEVSLTGAVRPVNGVLSAVGSGLQNGTDLFLVPRENLLEANALKRGRVFGISSLRQAAALLKDLSSGNCDNTNHNAFSLDSLDSKAIDFNPQKGLGDFADIKGHWLLKRALEIAAAGRHNVLLFGPPGSGKTMAARRLPTILPPLTWEESLTVTRLHSIAGLLPEGTGIIHQPPFRMPHHSASSEGIIGGGKITKPGEVSLAHEGILFLDEAAEFKASLLQSLREPVEDGRVTIARAGLSVDFPASFQLILAVNPCPCGNLGRPKGVCICSTTEVYRYWKKLGGALLDRIDIRIPLKPVEAEQMSREDEETSASVLKRVQRAVSLQRERFRKNNFSRNCKISPGILNGICRLDSISSGLLKRAVEKLSLSSRAYHSILKIARTIADLDESESIKKDHVLEAIQHRRYGDGDVFWNYN